MTVSTNNKSNNMQCMDLLRNLFKMERICSQDHNGKFNRNCVHSFSFKICPKNIQDDHFEKF